MNKKQKLLVGVFVLLLIAIFGCASMQNVVTPMYINPEVGEYTGEEMTSWMPWTTIWDGDRLAAKMKFLHESNLIELERAAENDIRHYGFLNNALILNRKDAVEVRDAAFSPTGPGGLLLAGLPMLGIGAMCISKPGDKKKIKELENGKRK